MYSITAEYVKVWFLCSSDLKYIVGCDSSVGIATGYGLDYPGIEFLPIPVAARSEEWVCGRWLAGIAGSNSTGGMDVCLLWVLYSKRQKAKPGQSRQKSTYKKQKTKNKKKTTPCWGEIFRTRSYRPWDHPSLLYTGYRIFRGVKRPGRGVNHALPPSAEVKDRKELTFFVFCVITRRKVVWNRRFGTTHLSHYGFSGCWLGTLIDNVYYYYYY